MDLEADKSLILPSDLTGVRTRETIQLGSRRIIIATSVEKQKRVNAAPAIDRIRGLIDPNSPIDPELQQILDRIAAKNGSAKKPA